MYIKAFYSDPHFGHKNIITYCNRPFDDVHHMTECLITRYNEVVGPDDTVLWLGDCAFCKSSMFKDIMSRLNGHKLLILGNHDQAPGKMLDAGFDLVLDEMFMMIGDRLCRLKHFPYLHGEPAGERKDDRYAKRRPPFVKGEVLIHGHTHSPNRVNKNMVHVGVDAWDYRPALYDEVEALIKEIS